MLQPAVVVVALLAVSDLAAADPGAACHPVAVQTAVSAPAPARMSLGELTAWIAGVTCKRAVLAPDVADATPVDFVAPSRLTSRQALQLYLRAIAASGLVGEDTGDTLLIKLAAVKPAPPLPRRVR